MLDHPGTSYIIKMWREQFGGNKISNKPWTKFTDKPMTTKKVTSKILKSCFKILLTDTLIQKHNPLWKEKKASSSDVPTHEHSFIKYHDNFSSQLINYHSNVVHPVFLLFWWRLWSRKCHWSSKGKMRSTKVSCWRWTYRTKKTSTSKDTWSCNCSWRWWRSQVVLS